MTTPPPRAGRPSSDANWRRDGGDGPVAGHTPHGEAPVPGQGPAPSDIPVAGEAPPRTGHRASHRARAGGGSARQGTGSARQGTGSARAGGDGPRVSGTAPEDVSVVRSSGVMALGTLASRATGFLRTLVLAYVLGVGLVANAYNNANTLPNAVYDLMLGGILTSVVVPLLVNAAKRDADGGEAYDQRMFTLATVALFALTVVATLAASLLVGLYAHAFTGAQHHLTVIFAYFFIPQVFFYGMSSLAGAVLNARGHFAAPMWTPLINNIVVIAVLLLFIAIGGAGTSPSDISAGQVQLLGFGTTLGIVAQTAALVPVLRRVGFRWQPRFDFRRDEVAEIIRMAAPLFGYILTTQVSFLVVQNVANKASGAAPYDGFSTYSYAWQLFQMPYAVVGISVITALLPRMSAHAAERRYADVRNDFSGGVRLSSVIVVPAALVLAVLGAPFAEALFGYGRTSATDAGYLGVVFGIFSLGLVPYMMFQLMLRVFYALHDSKTPMYIGGAVMIANIAASVASIVLLPAGHVVEGLAAAFGVANIIGTAISWRILSKRMHGLGGREIAGSVARMHVAAIPGAIFGLATTFAVGVLLSPGPAFGIITMVVGGAGSLLLYVLFARALNIIELDELTAGLRTRLRG
jgi:putative peptidoglycan lipid II flippase